MLERKKAITQCNSICSFTLPLNKFLWNEDRIHRQMMETVTENKVLDTDRRSMKLSFFLSSE